MKNYFANKMMVALSAASMLTVFTSCEKSVMDDEGLAPGQVGNSSTLTVTTRGDGSEEDPVSQARIYIFDQTGKCVQLLSTDEQNNTADVRMPPGTYTLCAVGGTDLNRFDLPTLSDATTTSAVTLKDGEVMDDLLHKRLTLTLEKDEDKDLAISLERKVICLKEVEVKDVPAEVSAVEITLSPLYSALQLSGTFSDTEPQDYQLTLSEQADGTTWKATPQALLFPSMGTPSLTINFTKSDGFESYTYIIPEALTANRHYSLSGTCKTTRNVTFSATLTAADWAEDVNVEFDFDESNSSFADLEAGNFANGYFVVSVDETARRAVLLAKENLSYDAPADGSEASVWRAALTAPMAALAKPVSTSNNWRLPTTEEAAVFTKDTRIIHFDSGNSTPSYYCEDEGVLYWAYMHKTDTGDFQPKKGISGFKSFVRLCPVIEIEY